MGRHQQNGPWQGTNNAVHSIKSTSISLFNSIFPGQNDRDFAQEILKRIFCMKKVRFLTKVSLKFVPNGPTDDNLALV